MRGFAEEDIGAQAYGGCVAIRLRTMFDVKGDIYRSL